MICSQWIVVCRTLDSRQYGSCCLHLSCTPFMPLPKSRNGQHFSNLERASAKFTRASNAQRDVSPLLPMCLEDSICDCATLCSSVRINYLSFLQSAWTQHSVLAFSIQNECVRELLPTGYLLLLLFLRGVFNGHQRLDSQKDQHVSPHLTGQANYHPHLLQVIFFM